MRSARLDCFLAGTAMALVLPLALSLTVSAQDSAMPPAAGIEAAIPVPDTADLPPLTLQDITPAPQQGAPAEMAAQPAPANAAVTEKLRELAQGKFDRLIGSRKDRESIESFYKARDYAPLWIDHGAVNARGQAAAKYLAGVARDGLDPADYPTPAIKADADAAAQAEAEIRMSESVVTFARHAQIGRVHYTRISADISYNLQRPEPADVLAKLASAGDTAAALDGFTPQHPGYKALKAKLAELREGPKPQSEPEVERVRIPEGPLLRPGMSDERVIALRKRLSIAADANSDRYDDTVVEAVKAFQKEHELGVDGVLGRNTVRAMNGGQHPHRPVANKIDTIIANLERWRWLPHDLGRTYVMVNIPDFTLRVVRDQKLVWSTKIVVGKPNLKTPLISASMKYITVNPTWNVPPSIIRNEYLPVIQQDPNALARVGLKMETNPDGTIRIFQPPGDRNALGRIRFNFPNKFLVYQHDTPDKKLFSRDPRAYSHGCMRVQDPVKYAEVLLSLVMPGKGYTQERLRKMYGGSEININFPTAIPVHLTYQTAFVNDAGNLVIRHDLYGWDSAVLSWLNGSQRKVADIAIDRPKSSSSAPVMAPAGLMSRGTRDDDSFFARGNRGPSFFERLFGVEPAEPMFEEPRRAPRRRNVSEGRHFFGLN